MDGQNLLKIEEGIELESSESDELAPLLSKGEPELIDNKDLSEESYGTFATGPQTLTLGQRRSILNKQQTTFQELEMRFGTNEKMSFKLTKFISETLRRFKDSSSYVRIWGGSIKQIEGQFGSGVCTYFKVMVWLLKINVLCMILGLCLIVGPGGYMVHQHHDHTHVQDTIYNKDDLDCTNPSFVNGTGCHVELVNSVLQLLTGTGWMESTAMFYGWYPTDNLTRNTKGEEKTVYHFSLAYFTVGISYFFISLLFMLYNFSKQFNKSAAEQFETKPYASKVLTFDYTIHEMKASDRQRETIIQSLKEKVVEDAQEGLKRDFWTKVGIFFLRLVTNTICIAGMIGTVYLYVHQILTDSSESRANATDHCGRLNQEDPLEALDLEGITNANITEHLSAFWSTYSASIIVSGSNVILPVFFQFVGTFEMYRFQSTRVGITLLRMFIMKLFNISMFLYILYIAVGPSGGRTEPWQTMENTLLFNCWEDFIASQLYQLVIVDFIVFCITLLIADLKSLFVSRISFCRERLGKPEFDIATEILDLVHKQMIWWSGFYFSPLFPVLSVIEVIAIFYLKKTSSLRNVISPKTVVLNHQSTFTINCLFLISLLVVFVFMGLVIFNFHPSTTCGPFRGDTKFSDSFSRVIDQSVVQKYILDNIKTTSVFVILIILIVLVIYYYRSLATSRKVTIVLLENQVREEVTEREYIMEHVIGSATRDQVSAESSKRKRKRRVSKIL